MNRFEFRRKLDTAIGLIGNGQYREACAITDQLDLDQLEDPNVLQKVSKAYEKCRRYDKAEEILVQAKDFAPRSRTILYRLCSVAVKAGNPEDAETYYEGFMEIASQDPKRFILLYRIAEAKEDSYENRIRILEEYRAEDPDDKWMYELARLYAVSGRTEEAIALCDEIELWYDSGKYVDYTKMLHAGLDSSYVPSSPEPEVVRITNPNHLKTTEEADGENSGDAEGVAYAQPVQATRRMDAVREENSSRMPDAAEETDTDAVQEEKTQEEQYPSSYEQPAGSRNSLFRFGIHRAHRKNPSGTVEEEPQVPDEPAESMPEGVPETEETAEAQPEMQETAAEEKSDIRDEVTAEAEAAPEAEKEPEIEAEPETEKAPEAEAEPEVEAAPETEMESETETEPEAEAEPETEAEPEAEAEPEPETEAAPESENTPTETGEHQPDIAADDTYGKRIGFVQPEIILQEEEEEISVLHDTEEEDNFIYTMEAGLFREDDVYSPGEPEEDILPVTEHDDTECGVETDEEPETGAPEVSGAPEIGSPVIEIPAVEIPVAEAEDETESAIPEMPDLTFEFNDDADSFEYELKRRQKDSRLFGNLPVEPEMSDRIWHFMVFGSTDRETLEYAREIMKTIKDNGGSCPPQMLKISAAKIGTASIIKSLDLFLGRMVIIEQAGMLSDAQLREFVKVLEKDDRSLLVAFTDTRNNVIRMFERVPELNQSFTAVYEGKKLNARDLVNTALEYLYRQGAKTNRAAEGMIYEYARVLLASDKGFYKNDIRRYAEEALSYADKGGLFGFTAAKTDKDGYLIVTEKHFRKAETK